MAGTPLILLPPSEGKSAGGDGPPLNIESLSFEALNPTRVRVAKSLVQLSQRPRSSKKILGVKGPALEKAMSENASIEDSPSMRAIERYTGVMYDAISYKSLGPDARSAFDHNVIIFSGLFGMIRPADNIPAYKLKMGATILRRKSCAAIWKPLISKSLANDLDTDVIWDLLPAEHSAAWNPSSVPYQTRFTVKFLDRAPDGQIKTVSHFSKALKGALVRHLVSDSAAAGSPGSALDFVSEFEHADGYRFSPEMTTEVNGATEIVFLKNPAE